MAISQKTIRDPLLGVRDAITRRPNFSATFAGDEPLRRVELFRREQIAQHGRVRAARSCLHARTRFRADAGLAVGQFGAISGMMKHVRARRECGKAQ
jgi:hypothetical protein